MKKRIIIITIILSLLAGVGGILYGYAAEYYETLSVERLTQEVQADITVKKGRMKQEIASSDFIKLMTVQEYYADEINRCMEKLFRLAAIYDFSEQDFQEFYHLVEEGYQFSKLLDIYIFALDTEYPNDISYAKKLYDEAATVYTTSKYWIEEAYNRLEQGKHGLIDVTDITYYNEQGISNDEIALVNVLSRKGNYQVKDILDRKVSGETWNQITAEVYGNTKLNTGKMKKISSLKNIMDCVYYADVTHDSLDEIADGQRADKLSKKSKIKMNGKLQLSHELANEYRFATEEEILDAAKKKLPRSSEVKLKQYLKEGYLIRELEKFQQEADRAGISLDEYMD